jgi:hypothetical protein
MDARHLKKITTSVFDDPSETLSERNAGMRLSGVGG